TAPAGATAATPATQTPRLVRLTLDGRAGALFGLVPLDHDVDRQFAGDPRARVWVIDPSDGEARRPGPLTASGDGVAGRDATVRVRLVRAGRTVAEQVVPLVPAPGSAGPLRPGQRGTWRVTGWDAATPGAYRLEVSAPDDGGIPWTDNAEFTVR
ncbi:MAG TPA: hypothetical protein VE781_01300, partial [Kineosporiaceae bacterium]|nr:hypothetical protein [Kineosporiaceae bacterium]